MISSLAAYVLTMILSLNNTVPYMAEQDKFDYLNVLGITLAEEKTEEDKISEDDGTIFAEGKNEEEKPSNYNDAKSWWFRRNTDKTPPTAQGEINLSEYDAYYLGDTSEKKIYLTFDEGYENGCTHEILDILKENDVKAAFFVTKSYIKSEPELVKRMAEEGHIVGNHSVTHPDMTTLTDDEVREEILGCAQYYKEVTGYDMPKFFRPPAGGYSVRTLEITKDVGYKTIFWSYAYKDWLVDEQPGRDVAYQNAMDYTHNGCIMLLHAVSTSNTEALDDILKDLKAQGFEFVSLEELN